MLISWCEKSNGSKKSTVVIRFFVRSDTATFDPQTRNDVEKNKEQERKIQKQEVNKLLFIYISTSSSSVPSLTINPTLPQATKQVMNQRYQL